MSGALDFDAEATASQERRARHRAYKVVVLNHHRSIKGMARTTGPAAAGRRLREQSGEITETLAFRELLTELLGGDQNIMYEEWESYYTVKLAHLDDDAFCTRLSRTWGGKGSGGFAFVPQKRLDALEEVLLVSLSSQGSEREVLTRVFKKYDSNQDNMLQLDE